MRFAALCVLVGCGSAAPAAPAPVAETPCPAVAQHVGALFGMGTDHALRVHDALLARCTADRWPEAAKRCFLDQRDLHAGGHCQDRLGEHHRHALAVALDGARLPAIDPSADACELETTLVARLSACSAIDDDTRQLAASQSGEIPGVVRDDRMSPTRVTPPPSREEPVRRPPRGRVVVEGLPASVREEQQRECRGRVDALVSLGAERCGW